MSPGSSGEWTIYALIDPNTKTVRYVGVTSCSLKRRLSQHLSDKRIPSPKTAWIESLQASGQKPEIIAIESGTGPSWSDAECHWISHYATLGPLTNTSPGGSMPSEEGRLRISAKLTGVAKSDEMKKRLSASKKGNVHVSEEQRRQVSLFHTGRKQPPDEIERRAIAVREGYRRLREDHPEEYAQVWAARGAKRKGIQAPWLHTHEVRMKAAATLAARSNEPELRARRSAASKISNAKAKENGYTPSAETRAKWSAQRKGKAWPEEIIQKRSAAARAQASTPEAKAVKSATMRRIWEERRAGIRPPIKRKESP